MKILHLNAGAETGGGMFHILQLLEGFNQAEVILGLLEKGLMYEKAINKGIQVALFQQSSRTDFMVVKRIISYIDSNKIDIIHTHGPRANFYGYYIKKKRPQCKWVTTLHSNPELDFMGRGLPGKVFTHLHLWSLKKPDHFLAISNKFKEILVDRNISPDKITTIFNGIDFTDISMNHTVSREEFGFDSKDFIIIMVARFDPVKGHREVLKVLKELVAEDKNVKLLLVGDGHLENEIKSQAAVSKLDGNIKFLGYRTDVPSLYSLADLALLASYSESFPLVLLEAARERKPVVTTDVGGVRDLIPSNEYGWVVPVRDNEALKKAIEEAIKLKEEKQLSSIGNKLYQRSSSLFTVGNFRDSVYAAYQKVLY